MTILVPNKVDGLSNLQNKFSWEVLTNASRTNADIELYLPKFEIEFAVDLEDILRKVLIIHFAHKMFKNIAIQWYMTILAWLKKHV